MRRHTYIGLLAAMVLLAACDEQPEISILNKGELALTARTESSTKTVVTNETYVYWEPGDEIVVFAGDERSQFTTDLESPAATAIFKGSFSKDVSASDLWALYPYNTDATFDGAHFTTTIPTTQTARAGSFAKGMNISVAHSSGTDLQFYNVGGGLRFSVTEEGIKKVIFEGLNGETIAGTVAIGFEEGLPKVTGVSSGSQFITLIPPDGETFQTNTWYFIVAIPGSLEKGYKMRFYKTNDYARRVTEKAVTIVRSIYGSVAAADEGLTYEATTTKFPETEEEWEETEQRAKEIGPIITDIVSSSDYSDYLKQEETLVGIDGVLGAHVDPSSGAVSVLMKDSVWLYYFHGDEEASIPDFETEVSTKASKASHSKVLASNNESGVNADKKALILAPFFGNDSKRVKELLINAGFKEDNIIIKKGDDADILLFKGDHLRQYKYVYIITHGGTAYQKVPYDDDSWVSNQTCFLSGTSFSAHKALSLIATNKLRKDQIAIGYHENENSHESDRDYRFCMLPNFLDNFDFSGEKPYIVLGACMSDAINHNQRGSMVNAFLSKGVGAIGGYSASISSNVNSCLTTEILMLMSNGFSFQKASQYWKESQIVKDYCISGRNYRLYIDGVSENEVKSIDQSLYNFYPNSPDFYLVNPFPLLKDPQKMDSDSIRFSWKCDLKSFTEICSFQNYHEASASHYYRELIGVAEYDLYVDSFLVKTTSGSDDSAKQVTVEVPACGEHSWYVVGKLILDGNVEATYKSKIGHFTVDGGATTVCPSNQIWYTTTDGEIVIPSGDAYGANIISNTYENGKGIITFDDAIQKVSSSAFEDCSTLASITIPEGVTSIGQFAFRGCSSLSSIMIPESVNNIGYGTFIGCTDLTSITIPESVTSIGGYAFSSCSGLTSITIPDGVTSIEPSTFAGCTGLSSITIPDKVSSIGSDAFFYCSSLISIVIPEIVTSIGGGAFGRCSGLTSITIPDGITSIEPSTFAGCSGLLSISIPKGVTNIGRWAFSGCSGLSSITIPGDVSSIGEHAFGQCSGLTSVIISGGVKSIGEQAFISCDNLANVSIPGSVSSIGQSAFAHCGCLTSITIPKGVTSIGSSAFEDCSGLITITIPVGVTSIEPNTFRQCVSLSSFTIPEGVTSIGTCAFWGCGNMTSVSIPNSIKSIGLSAFSFCSSLISVKIPKGVSCIEQNTFAGCSSLSSITIPDSVTSISIYAFSGCSSLTSVTIPDSVTSLGSWAFEGCSSLVSVTVPDGMTTIGAYVFNGCSDLKSFTIPKGVTAIESYTFNNCSSMTSIKIPETVTSIGNYSFYSCKSLIAITIPDGVTSIGKFAFSECDSLSSVTILAIIPPVGSAGMFINANDFFDPNASPAPIYVPAGSVDAYKNSDYWKGYSDRIRSL